MLLLWFHLNINSTFFKTNEDFFFTCVGFIILKNKTTCYIFYPCEIKEKSRKGRRKMMRNANRTVTYLSVVNFVLKFDKTELKRLKVRNTVALPQQRGRLWAHVCSLFVTNKVSCIRVPILCFVLNFYKNIGCNYVKKLFMVGLWFKTWCND